MRASSDKWWLLPLGILTASSLVAVGIVVLGPSFAGRSSDDEVAQRADRQPTVTSEPAADCSGALATDYACYQQRYQDLVSGSSVEAAFAELKDEYANNDFVSSNCHQLTHVIGRAAAELYGDIPTTYGYGDDLCTAGYYHGAMEAFVAKIGADKLLDEANTLCADLGEHQKHSFYHYDCAHGLGHGFMGVYENDLFESLRACDALTDGWEKDPCYAGVFMQNVMAEDDPSHPSKHLKADRPLHPCIDVQARYKTPCYRIQTSYALRTQGYDFAKVFELCATEAEDGFRPACYQGLGGYASMQSIQQNTTDVAQNGTIGTLCMLGEDYEARSNCVVGAAKQFILHYHGDMQAKALCESFDADLRAVCLQGGEEFYGSFL
jgi:hypothetical protein